MKRKRSTVFDDFDLFISRATGAATIEGDPFKLEEALAQDVFLLLVLLFRSAWAIKIRTFAGDDLPTDGVVQTTIFSVGNRPVASLTIEEADGLDGYDYYIITDFNSDIERQIPDFLIMKGMLSEENLN